MFAVSTSWDFRQHTHAKDMLEEIKQLGINGVELNFNLSGEIAKEFTILRKEGKVNIVSLHNYCPIPKKIDPKKASPDNPSLSSTDETERRQAVECTKHTIDFASEIGAKAVVLHIGKVDIKDRTVKLGRIDKRTPLYAGMKAKMEKEREESAKPHFETAIKSMGELEPYARRRGIYLGIENRYYFNEIPSIEEMSYILEHFGDSSIYYWHDVGHAQVQENLGFLKHEDYLRRFSNRLIGVHLHDIIGVEDHMVAGKGEFNFKRLLPYVKTDTLKVIEAHQPATVDDMAKGLKFLKDIFKGE